MLIPKAPDKYDPADQDVLRLAIKSEDAKNVKSPIILTASDGSRWKVVVSTSGVLSTVAA